MLNDTVFDSDFEGNTTGVTVERSADTKIESNYFEASIHNITASGVADGLRVLNNWITTGTAADSIELSSGASPWIEGNNEGGDTPSTCFLNFSTFPSIVHNGINLTYTSNTVCLAGVATLPPGEDFDTETNTINISDGNFNGPIGMTTPAIGSFIAIAGAGTATFAAGAGAGTSASTPLCESICDSISGYANFNSGATPPTTGLVATITLGGVTRSHEPNCTGLLFLASTGAPVPGANVLRIYDNTTQAQILVTGTALSASTAYSFVYQCLGK
jgi:hypothetical protein